MLAEGAAVDVRESGDGRPTLALITYCTYLADRPWGSWRREGKHRVVEQGVSAVYEGH